MTKGVDASQWRRGEIGGFGGRPQVVPTDMRWAGNKKTGYPFGGSQFLLFITF